MQATLGMPARNDFPGVSETTCIGVPFARQTATRSQNSRAFKSRIPFDECRPAALPQTPTNNHNKRLIFTFSVICRRRPRGSAPPRPRNASFAPVPGGMPLRRVPGAATPTSRRQPRRTELPACHRPPRQAIRSSPLADRNAVVDARCSGGSADRRERGADCLQGITMSVPVCLWSSLKLACVLTKPSLGRLKRAGDVDTGSLHAETASQPSPGGNFTGARRRLPPAPARCN